MSDSRLHVVDLFCGAGGLSLGLGRAGIDVRAGFDADPRAIETYNRNFTHPGLLRDLSNGLLATSQASKYLGSGGMGIVGGPPCQDFSAAGNGVEGSRANLTRIFAYVVDCLRPDFFVMENVTRSQQSVAYKDARRIFDKAGYHVRHYAAMASYFGVPQRRQRLFTFGALSPRFAPKLVEWLEDNRSERETTVREYAASVGVFFPEFYFVHPRSYERRAIFSIDTPAPTMRGQSRPMSANYKPHPGDSAPPECASALTLSQRAMLQTFPKDFSFSGSATSVNLQIGNAVPPVLAEVLGHGLRECLAGELP